MNMKKWTILFVSMLVMSVTTWAGNDKPIQISQMPQAAQQFIKKHFTNQSVAVAKVETELLDKNYDVIFTNGDKVEFNKKGQWTNIDCKHTQVPVEVIPMAIQKYVSQQFPNAKVVKIEITDRKGYEVDLSNGFDIEFDKKMNVIDLDK
jgi:hypothetical protein